MANDLPLTTFASTYNQQNFGAYFDLAKLDLGNPLAQMLRDQLDLLPNPAAVQSALDSLSGEIYGTHAIMQIQSMSRLMSAIATQTNHNHGAGIPCLDELWYSGYAFGGEVTNDGNAHSTDFQTLGHVIGKSWCDSDNSIMGIFYNYEDQETSSVAVNSQIDTDAHRLGFYLHRHNDFFHSELTAFAGWNNMDASRTVPVNAILDKNKSSYNAWNTGVYFENGLTYGNQYATVQPYIALQLLQYVSDDLNETGGPATTLNVDDIHLNSFRTILGGRLNLATLFNAVSFEFEGAWVHENADTVADYHAGLTSTPGVGFQAKGSDLGDDWVNFGPSLNWTIGPVRSFIQYQAAVGDQATLHTGQWTSEILW